jgi:DNA-directed RNA polymerase specialized sigma subunit
MIHDDWLVGVSQGKKRIQRALERELIEMYKIGSEEDVAYAKEELLAYNALAIVGLALEVFHSFPLAHRMDPMDLVMPGVVEFFRKLDTFDPKRGTRLITHYTRDVKTKMQRTALRYAAIIPQGSVYLQHLGSKQVRVRKELSQKLGRPSTLEEEASALNTRVKTLKLIERCTQIQMMNMDEIDIEVQFKDKSVVDELSEILRTKFHFLSENDFQDLYLNLYNGDKVPLRVMQMIEPFTERLN